MALRASLELACIGRRFLRLAPAAVLILMSLAALQIGLCAQSASVASPPIITLQDAIARAQKLDATFASAISEQAVASAQVGVARAALLPGVVYHNQFLYTQPQHLGGKPVATGASSPVFIANNGVHEYVSQGVVSETFGLNALADYRRANAEAAAARARLEVARRGLVSTVVTNYFAILVADEKLAVQRRALDQAQHFRTLSSQLEAGGEVAHADTLKATLEVQQQQRSLGDAQLTAERARVDLAVLLFQNPLTSYAVEGDLHALRALPQRSQVDAAATQANPDVRAALASFRAASLELTSARFDYLPSLSVNYVYGIDAPQFAITAPDGSRNLGYAALATLDIPVFDWFATRNRIRQSAARRDLAQAELSSTQRQLLASIEELYREAQESQQQTISFDQSARDATEALRLTELRYTSGEAPILEVVDAQNTLIAIGSGRADSAARYLTALANLETLTGNLP